MDSGNSRLKCRAISVDDFTILGHATIPNDQIEILESTLATWTGEFGKASHVYAVSVASMEVRQHIERQVSTLGLTVQWLNVERSALGVENAYDIQQMGKDRWYGVLGAYGYNIHIDSKGNQVAVTNKAFLYISFGTATTIDVVVEQQYLGGVIFPGVQLMQRSLFHGTAQLPEIHLHEARAEAFPTNTEKAIESGIVIAQAGAVLCQIQRVYEQYQLVPTLYVSGGARYAVMQEIHLTYAHWRTMCHSDVLPTLQIIELEAPVLDGIQAWVESHINQPSTAIVFG